MYDYQEIPEQRPAGRGCGTIFVIIPLSVLIVSALLFAGLNAMRNPDALPANSGYHANTNLAPFFTKEVLYWSSSIESWAQEHDLDPNLVATVMQIESCGHPAVESHAGAKGLFQVMPFHFAENEDPFDPNTNALRGLNYLVAALEDKNGDIRLGLAGYNGGISGSRRPEAEWPAETVRYVYWGTGIYADALAGNQDSLRLETWLASGGASLCARAAQHLNLAP